MNKYDYIESMTALETGDINLICLSYQSLCEFVKAGKLRVEHKEHPGSYMHHSDYTHTFYTLDGREVRTFTSNSGFGVGFESFPRYFNQNLNRWCDRSPLIQQCIDSLK